MNFWCCSFLFVTCVHTGVIFCSLYFLTGDCNEGSQPCPQGRGSLWMEWALLKSWGSGCKMEEHSSALHCVQHPDQCRSLCSQREHICHIPSILSFYSVWFRRGLVRSKYLDTKGMWKRGSKKFQATRNYIFTPKKDEIWSDFYVFAFSENQDKGLQVLIQKLPRHRNCQQINACRMRNLWKAFHIAVYLGSLFSADQ